MTHQSSTNFTSAPVGVQHGPRTECCSLLFIPCARRDHWAGQLCWGLVHLDPPRGSYKVLSSCWRRKRLVLRLTTSMAPGPRLQDSLPSTS